MAESCPNCGSILKNEDISMLSGKLKVTLPYCSKCEFHASIPESLILVSGKALRGIDKKTGQFRMKVIGPEDRKRDLIVQTFPRYIVTKPSEWRVSGRRVYQTKERTAKVFPELTRNDEITIVGYMQEGIPLMSVMMHNSSIGITSIFIEDRIKLKKGIFSSFTIKNPLLVQAEEIMNQYLG